MDLPARPAQQAGEIVQALHVPEVGCLARVGHRPVVALAPEDGTWHGGLRHGHIPARIDRGGKRRDTVPDPGQVQLSADALRPGKLGVQIVVQNVEGSGGTVAAGEVSQAKPDGYTVLMHHIGMSTAPALYADLPYKPLEDFKTIGLVTEVPMTLIARRDFQPNTLQELVDYVKANADKVTYANAGIGAASHLCGLLFQKAVGVKLQEVPYEGTGPALTDIVGGQVDFMCDQTTNTTGQIKSREVKAYAVTTPERVKSLPDVPTAKEAGLDDLELTVWHGLYVPADTPDQVVQTLSDALKVALADQGVIDKLAELGTAPVAADRATPEAHHQQLEEQLGVWGPIIEEAGVKAS